MKILVWDIPTRIFHWGLVAACITAYITSRTERFLDLHVTAGYALACFILFRVVWGIVGGKFSRFTEFVKGPKEVLSYLSKMLSFKPPRCTGHNPAVGWVVIFMLVMLAVIAASGAVVYSGEENRGFMAGYFSFSTAQYALSLHAFIAYFFVSVIVVHVAAAFIHEFVFHEEMIVVMITGKKEDSAGFAAQHGIVEKNSVGRSARLAIFLLLSVLVGWMLVSFNIASVLSSPKIVDSVAVVNMIDNKGVVRPFEVNELWLGECGESCHTPFHPTLLPESSWRVVMAGLGEHFEEDASLDSEDTEEILTYLIANSAERSTSEASKKILWTYPKGSVLLRITKTPYWIKKHSKIKEDVFKRESVTSPSNCAACHRDADRGVFDDTQIVVPD